MRGVCSVAIAVCGVGLWGCGRESERASPPTPEKPSPPEGDSAMPGSPLERAIERGMKAGANLADELRELGEIKIRTRSDAQAICRALALFPLTRADKAASGFRSPLHALTALFQDVDSREAFDVLRAEGTTQLVRIADAMLAKPAAEEAGDLLFVLKVLAMYHTREGAERILRAARTPVKPDDWMWHVIFSAFAEDHPERDGVFRSFLESLPEGFIAVALLDAANEAAIEGKLKQHPFDSPAGKQRLREWLTDAGMLRQWKGGELQKAEVICVAELSPRLKHPQKLVALASATLGGEEGWAVLDGPRSAWYPKADMPEGSYETTVLEMHVGRQLLGF
ncbi:MAG: hypothetical protein FJ290_31630, partial [Planctomycetes bacterium]|nr:hypothetical protein [Planctomycetota bacterium]